MTTDLPEISRRLREIADDRPNEGEAYRLIADALDELDVREPHDDVDLDALAADVRELQERLDALDV